jgi:adenosine deaminase
MPKAQLHLHLDGAASYAAVAALAPGTSLADYRRDFVAPAKCTNLVDFLTRPPRIVALMQDARGLRLIVDDLFDQLLRDGTIYVEIRFAPHLHLEGCLGPREVVDIVERATDAAVAATGVEARIILCTLRHFTAEQSLETAELVRDFRGSRVVALDIAGDEAGFPLDAHRPAFHLAESEGLFRTAHAGEASGAASVWETLDALRPNRVGHGVRSVEDPALVEHLRAERIHLEVCPTCNVQIGVFERYGDHPIDELFRAGVHLSVNTDAPTIADVTLSLEYERLREAFGWTDTELLACTRNAIEAAFVDELTRARLLARLTASPGSSSSPPAAPAPSLPPRP